MDVPVSTIEGRDEHERYVQSLKEELQRLDVFESLNRKEWDGDFV